MWAALALAVATTLVGAGSASAILVHVHGGTVSFQAPPGHVQSGAPAAKPQNGSVKPVEYHGGPVMSSNTNYAVYWAPAGAPEYAAGYETGIDRYFEDLAHDSGGLLNTDSVLTQYGDTAGEFANYDAHFGGALVDTDPYPANGCSAAPICLTDEQIRRELTSYVEAHGLPADLEHEYFLSPPRASKAASKPKGTPVRREPSMPPTAHTMASSRLTAASSSTRTRRTWTPRTVTPAKNTPTTMHRMQRSVEGSCMSTTSRLQTRS